MGGVAGFAGFGESLWEERYLWGNLGKRMGKRLSHRGPDENGTHVSPHCVLSHVRLALSDPLFGKQPFTVTVGKYTYTIVFDGALYNASELRKTLCTRGYRFETESDTEVLLYSYIEYGEACPNRLLGMFAFAIDDQRRNRLFLCRDHLGVKPLYFTFSGERLVFASEIKALLEYPGVKPVIDREGVCQLFGLGPTHRPGSGIFKNFHELKGGEYALYSSEGFHIKAYYKLTSTPCEDSYDQAVERVRFLLRDSVHRQLPQTTSYCSLLSGGLDSSLLTAFARQERPTEVLTSYSIAFEGNDTFFSPTRYEPSADEAWASRAAEALGTEHQSLICGNATLFQQLSDSVIAKDLPGMGDIDSSLLHFCHQIKKQHAIAVCGEGADEIFSGYPWFRSELQGTFPWSNSLPLRESLLSPEIAQAVDLPTFVRECYEEALWNTPLISGESESAQRHRQMQYLNLSYFMPMLFERLDRASMYSGLQVRLPYADHRLLQYVFNCPECYQCKNGVQKSLLRDAATGLLPDEFIYRKKSPFPKTHNPAYEVLLKTKLRFVLRDPLQPLHKLINRATADALLGETFDYGTPWFGQLMAGPQLIAYLLQVNYWMLRYNVYLDL